MTKRWFFVFIAFLGINGCGMRSDPVVLYNEGVRLWNEGNKPEALWYVKKAYVLSPHLQQVGATYQRMRMEFMDKPAERMVFGVGGLNTLAWLGVLCLVFAGVLVVVRSGEWEWNVLVRISQWRFLKHMIVVWYLFATVLLVGQGIAAWQLFSKEPAVVVAKGVLGDRPEESALSLGEVNAGTEGWILRREKGFVLFRGEDMREGWMQTNNCRGVLR